MKIVGRVRDWFKGFASLRDFGWRSLDGLGRIELGQWGERVAERHLRRKGYRILERNFRRAGVEIDLVAMDGPTLVFVEVKTRRTETVGTPQESVNAYKQRHIRRAGEIYARSHRVQDHPMRFDVVAIVADRRGRRLELLKDAF